jgi:hypothetical protein
MLTGVGGYDAVDLTPWGKVIASVTAVIAGSINDKLC